MPSERSSASAMTGEKAEREKARSISLQTCCKPACTTARVRASERAHALILRLPIASTTATAPGSITVVASICCTTAGPSMRASAGSASRA